MRYFTLPEGAVPVGAKPLRGFTTPSVHAMLRQARKVAGLTQAEVARRMGTTQSVISRAESLTGPNPTVKFLERFAYATGQTLAPAIGKEEAPRKFARTEALAEGRRLRRLSRRLGCAWISAVGTTDLVVRTNEGADLSLLSLAARRLFIRDVTIIDLDRVKGRKPRKELFRSRKNVARALIGPGCPPPVTSVAPARAANRAAELEFLEIRDG